MVIFQLALALLRSSKYSTFIHIVITSRYAILLKHCRFFSILFCMCSPECFHFIYPIIPAWAISIKSPS